MYFVWIDPTRWYRGQHRGEYSVQWGGVDFERCEKLCLMEGGILLGGVELGESNAWFWEVGVKVLMVMIMSIRKMVMK